MHSWKAMLDTLEGVGMPKTFGFQADLAHTYLYLIGRQRTRSRPPQGRLHFGTVLARLP
jgi:hypothetical protein